MKERFSNGLRQTASAFLVAVLATIAFGCAAFGQDPVASAVKMGFTDVAETKRQAEAGDRAAQLSLANTLVNNMRPADALPWYQKAAAQGSVEAVCKMGGLLIKGSPGVPSEKTLQADPATGIQLIFCAATNRYTTAYS